MVKIRKFDLDGNPKIGGDMKFIDCRVGFVNFHPPLIIINKNFSPCGHRRRRKELIFEHPPPLIKYELSRNN